MLAKNEALSNTAHFDIILSCCIQRHWIKELGGIIHNIQTRRIGKQLPLHRGRLAIRSQWLWPQNVHAASAHGKLCKTLSRHPTSRISSSFPMPPSSPLWCSHSVEKH